MNITEIVYISFSEDFIIHCQKKTPFDVPGD